MRAPALILTCLGLLACTGAADAATGAFAPFRPAGSASAMTPVQVAETAIEQRPALVDGADAGQLVVADTVRVATGATIVRFEQEIAGIPVLGAGAVVGVDRARRVVLADGEAYDGPLPALGPSITAAQARQIALAVVAKRSGPGLSAEPPLLTVYDAAIVGGPGPLRPALTWDVTVTRGDDVRQRVFIDATTGALVQRFDGIETALERYVCDAANAVAKVPCSSGYAREEGDAATGAADVDYAYDFAGRTWDAYNALGRDSVDDNGLPLRSTVRYCPALVPESCPYANAFWNGEQMVYGTDYALGDDVVAHELTHGVTDYTSGLLYWYQSGAINEAMSDIMGELVDLSHDDHLVDATDVPASDWLLGERLPIGAVRDMADPPAFGDPDRMGSPNYATGLSDSGGVHANSGVANKAAFLIADGGTFNGQTVTGIGREKSKRLWYETNLALRVSSDYSDLADALDQTCAGLVTAAVDGFTSGDCTQVAKAVLATEMRTDPAGANAVPAVCAAGETVVDAFRDRFDGGIAANWDGTADRWYSSADASPDGAVMQWPTSSSTNARGLDVGTPGIAELTQKSAVAIPTGAYLRFDSWYSFEGDGIDNFDAGVVEYSIDGGSTWVDIGSLTAVNGYSGTIDTHNYSDSPLKGRSGFVAASNGARTTRIDLSSLAGTSARFRFLVATDSGGSGTGWYLDDVRIYSCRGADTPAKPSTKPPTPVSKPPATKKPPAGGTWTVDRAKDRIVVKLPVIQSWSYRIRGVSGSRSAKGTCKRSGSIVICTLKARTARWRVTITAFNNRTSYAVTSRRVRT